jgi:hypothetical protein
MQCSNSIFCPFQAETLPARRVTVSVSKTSA